MSGVYATGQLLLHYNIDDGAWQLSGLSIANFRVFRFFQRLFQFSTYLHFLPGTGALQGQGQGGPHDTNLMLVTHKVNTCLGA